MTLFSFPARHHPLPSSQDATFETSFGQPTGLHPILKITLPRNDMPPPKEHCGLHAYWTLPSGLFIDRYQFSDPLFLASHRLLKLHSISGEQDLEAPDWVIKRWGSAALLELKSPSNLSQSTIARDGIPEEVPEWTVTVPMHLRYLTNGGDGTQGGSHTTLQVPWPVLFWACEAEEGLKMATNPFDRVNLGYDGLFGPKTMFYHIPPSSNVNATVAEIQVPILNSSEANWVPVGTLLAVAAGFAWVCWSLLRSTGGKETSSTRTDGGKKRQ